MTPSLRLAPPPQRQTIRLRGVILSAAGAAGVSLGMAVALHPAWWWSIVPAALVAVAITLRTRLITPFAPREVSRRDRQLTARTVRVMAGLPGAGFDVIHNLPGPRGLIEHVLVGPTGIFAVVCGDGPEACWRAARAALDVRGRLRTLRLGLPVIGVAVGNKAGEAPVPGVSRLRPADLVAFVHAAGRRLSDLQIERALSAILERHPSSLRPATV